LPEFRATADIVFPSQHIAVFIDGCFWHGCRDHCRRPATHAEFWEAKLAYNAQRDHLVNTALTDAGWTVMRFWSHESPESVAAQVVQAVRREPPPV